MSTQKSTEGRQFEREPIEPIDPIERQWTNRARWTRPAHLTLGVMSRTVLHLLYAMLWLGGFSLIVAALVRGTNPDLGHMSFYAQLGSIVWVMGFAGIFYSWARQDAPAHGRSVKSAMVFAALSPFFIILAHVAYFFFTRGFRNGTLATLKFFCFLLAAAIVWLLFGRGLGTLV